HHRFWWGLKLYVLAAPDGMPVAWCLANPKGGEREVAEVLLDRAARQGVLCPGIVTLADKGLAGREFQALVDELGATLARPDRADEPYRFGNLGGVRQWIEAIFDTLKDQLGLERHGAHTIYGLWVRVAQRLLALAAGVWFNWQLDAPVKASLVAYGPGTHKPIDISHLGDGPSAPSAAWPPRNGTGRVKIPPCIPPSGDAGRPARLDNGRAPSTHHAGAAMVGGTTTTVSARRR